MVIPKYIKDYNKKRKRLQNYLKINIGFPLHLS